MKQDHLHRFLATAFAFSWLLWLLPMLKSNGFPDLPESVGLLGMLAPFGPAVAAFWLTWRESGAAGAQRLWLRGWRLNSGRKWLIPALLLGPLVALLTVALLLAMGRSITWEHGVPLLMVVPIFLLIYVANALPEEYGWRGYALDPLQARFNALAASLILGAIWALWHLPLFFIEGTTQQAIPFYQFVLQTMLLAVFYTWLYNNTGGSVLIAALFHASANTAAAAIPSWTTELGRWLNFGLLAVIAGIIVWRWGWRRLSGRLVSTTVSQPTHSP